MCYVVVTLLSVLGKRFVSLYTRKQFVHSLHRTHIVSLAIIPGLERTIDGTTRGTRSTPLSMNEFTMNGPEFLHDL